MAMPGEGGDDISAAFRRYGHPDVVREFNSAPDEIQKVWLEALESICFNQCVDSMSLNFALLGEFRPQGGIPACPLHRAMNRRLREGVECDETVLEWLRKDLFAHLGKGLSL